MGGKCVPNFKTAQKTLHIDVFAPPAPFCSIQVAEYDNCKLLLVDKKISTARDMIGILEGAIRGGFPLLIMAEDIEQVGCGNLEGLGWPSWGTIRGGCWSLLRSLCPTAPHQFHQPAALPVFVFRAHRRRWPRWW